MMRWKETLSEPYSEHCQLSKIEPFAKILPGSSRLKLSQKVPAELSDWVLNMVSFKPLEYYRMMLLGCLSALL